MAKFLDTTGEDEWEIKITGGDLRELKRDLGLDLRVILTPQDGKFSEMLGDPEKQMDLMWFLCRDQARARFKRLTVEIEDEDSGEKDSITRSVRWQFEKLFDEDTTANAIAALWEAVWSFFRGQKAGAEARKMLLAATEGVRDLTTKAIEKLHAKLTGQTSSDSANTSAVSLGSTTADLPFVS